MQERQQHDEDLEHNNGVWWRATLTAMPITEQTARDKGIKRSADKVLPRNLPAIWTPSLPHTLLNCQEPHQIRSS